MATQTLIIDDFSGGINKRSPEKLAKNEAAELKQFLPIEGNLRSVDGRTKLNSTDLYYSGSVPFRGLFVYYDSSSVDKMVVAYAGRVYLDVSQTGDFRPLFAWTGSSSQNVSFCRAGNYLYMASGNNEALRRWDGKHYKTGTATCAGSTDAVSGTSTLWQTAETAGTIDSGDTIWFNIDGTWTGSYYIETITNETALVLTANGPNTGGAVNYIIARVHTAGITAPADVLASMGTAAGTELGIGTYKYKYTYVNTNTGYESNAVATAASQTTTSGNQRINYTLPASAQNPTDLQVNRIKVYRTKVGGSVYYLQATLDRTATGYTFTSSAQTDSTADASLGAQLETGHDKPILDLDKVILHNNRLYGWSTDNILRFSNSGAFEYWPTANIYEITDALSIEDYNTVGGYVTVGDAGISIKDAIPEGENLLVLKERGLSYRWYGQNWSDFMLLEAFSTSCISGFTGVNKDGILYWITRQGLVALAMGTNLPQPIYLKGWPFSSNSFEDLMKSITTEPYACIWGDWYVMACPQDSTTTWTTMLYHIPSRALTSLTDGNTVPQAECFAVWDGASTTLNGLYYGDIGAGATGYGFVWKLFSNTSTTTYWTPSTTGVSVSWKSPLYWFGESYDFNYDKKITSVELCWQRPSANQTATLKIYVDGNSTAKWGSTGNISVSASGTVGRVRTQVYPSIHAKSIQFELTGTFTKTMVLEYIKIEYEVEGRRRGV